MKFNRRGVLALMGSGSALGVPGVSLAQTVPDSVEFLHGIASGDPSAEGAIIWTRASAPENFTGDIALKWYVAAKPNGKPLTSGDVSAKASADNTAKVDVTGLKAGTDYHYWFEGPKGETSPVGRFRTLPVGASDRLVMAVASCQLYPGGLFNAYADMASLERLDVVIHLGDYIYEYDENGYGAEIGRKLGRLVDPPNEIVSLSDYRRRHAQVKTDPDLQAAHARAAFICVWDDHETANDSWIGGAENHQPDREGDWAARKAVAMQAYFEWMPIRDPEPVRAKEAIYRSFEFGDLATLAMVETRLLARSQQVHADPALPLAERVQAILSDRAQPDRELLGHGQREWVQDVLSQSVAAGKPWQVIGNQVVMARVNPPDFEKSMGEQEYAAMIEKVPSAYRERISGALTAYRAGMPFNSDSWDGYPAARERLYKALAEAGSRPIVLAGDSHAAWANDLYDDAGRLAAVEVGCTAITSPSYGSLIPGVGKAIADASPEVLFCDQDHKGYSLVTLTPTEARVDYVTVSTYLSKPFDRDVAASFTVKPGMSGGGLAKI